MTISGASIIYFEFLLKSCNVSFTFDELLMMRWRFDIIQSNWSVWFKIKKKKCGRGSINKYNMER